MARGLSHRRPGSLVHTSTDLERARPLPIDGIMTTGFDRTVLDLARRTSPQQVLRLLEHGRRRQLTTWASVIQTLRDHARRGRPGIARLREVVLANVHRDEVTDSDFELLFIALLLEHGLPEPVLHHRVMDGSRFVAEVDLAYVPERVALELDGAIHLDRTVRERDLPRQNDLILLGWTVLRFTWARFVQRPLAVVQEVRTALAHARASQPAHAHRPSA